MDIAPSHKFEEEVLQIALVDAQLVDTGMLFAARNVPIMVASSAACSSDASCKRSVPSGNAVQAIPGCASASSASVRSGSAVRTTR